MATLLPLVKKPDPRLRQRSRSLTREELASPKTQQLIDDMIATMWDADGIGIAAVQVGLNLRLVIITDDDKAISLINPRFIYRSFRKSTMEEGCLSVPGYFGPVRRSRSVLLRAFDREGRQIRLHATNLLARIIQHELDHINGYLFIDRATEVLPIPASD